MSETPGSAEQRVADAYERMAPIIALQGLRKAHEAARNIVGQTREAIRVMPQEVVPPEGQLFAIHFAENQRPISHGDREVRQGTYIPSDGLLPPKIEEPSVVIVHRNDPPFLAAVIAPTETHMLAVGLDGIAREFSHDGRDWVELVPNQTVAEISPTE